MTTAVAMTDQQRLTVHVLGRADLALGGHPLVDLASVKATALLIYLSVTGTGHPRSALAGLLWSDLPEATARANLRLVLTKLRRVVPGHLDVTRRTVALAAPAWVDAVEVARAVTAPDVDHAAVQLCGGGFLHGFDVPGAAVFDDWVAARRAAARADMLALLDRAARQARDRADPAAGIEVARRMLEVDRLHEEAHRALMWFLAAGGQRGAALAQFETCRYLLGEDLGIAPSAATAALRDEIAGAVTVAEPPLPQPSPSPAPPRPLTALVGRAAELTRLHALLDDPACRLVTLVGPGGIGKTRLAVEVAGARRDHRRHGAVFVSFAGTRADGRPDDTADLVVADLARAFGVSLTVPRDPVDLLAEHLGGRELLLVLDNLEHLPGAAAPLAELLRRAPGVQLLVTSRRPLGLGVEWLVEVPGLPYPPDGADPADVARYEAVQLFQERARLLRPGVETDLEGAGRICRLVGGLPLAIELAARWVRSAAPTAIADRLARGLELLETTAPDVEPRHRSIRSVIDASVRLLTDEERRALRRLSVQHGFDLAAAEAVADAGLPLLAGLVDQSLVTAGPDGRYAMHELLRQYAAGRLAEDPAEEAETRRRHAAHYDALLTADPAGQPRDAANLRAATEWFTGTADPAALDAHLQRVWTLYRRSGWFREAQAVLVAALRRSGVPGQYRGRWHRLLGEAHQQVGEAGAARHQLELALAALDSPVPTSRAGWLGMLAVQLARRALRFGTRPARSERHRDVYAERAASYFAINEVYWVLDEHRLTLPASLRALNDVERAGDPDLIARARAGVGMVAGSLGLHRVARRQLAVAVATVERTSDPLTACWVGIVGGLHWTGVADWAAVDTAAARVLPQQHNAPQHRWADEVLLIAGTAQHLTGRHTDAVASAAEGMAAGRDRHDPVVHLWGLLLLMEATLRADPADPALDGWLLEASGLLPAASRIDAARFHTAAARLHLAAGRRAEAWQAVRAADRLIGPRPALVQYGLEAHAGIAEVCQTLLEPGPAAGDRAEPAAVRGVEAAAVRAVEGAAVRRLWRYARTYPMARPRARIVLGRHLALRGRTRAALRAWDRAARDAERLRMPPEAAAVARLRAAAAP
ncbi:BTAD domain-containing putative transcriptional regulator [Dactylosporangium sp. NPDC049525]|uniref:ATP-binding protein n=1 Tax=Dactylosporangium sp. NPDC049525 TaxID=3154730 RepID=UPI003413AD84